MPNGNCPFCDYPFASCQCMFSGLAHPDRKKKISVVLQHLYLLDEDELKHVMDVQRSWNTSYGDPVMNVYLDNLKEKYYQCVLKKENL